MSWQEDFRELAKRKRKEVEEVRERKRQLAKDLETRIRKFGPIIEDVAQVLNGYISKQKAFDGDEIGEVHEERLWCLFLKGIGPVHIAFLHRDPQINMKCSLPRGESHNEYVDLGDTTDENTLKDRIRNALARCVEAMTPY